jgi:hypothetical protein
MQIPALISKILLYLSGSNGYCGIIIPCASARVALKSEDSRNAGGNNLLQVSSEYGYVCGVIAPVSPISLDHC